MHIAVCDDNVADRKQMERLLTRASDKRIHTTGVFYIDSYGNVESVMHSPMLYDAFFIDMTSGPVNGFQLARKLIDFGVTAPIILCISSINYREIIDTAASVDSECTGDHEILFQKIKTQIHFLNKPIRVAELDSMLDFCLTIKSQTIPTIELRGEQDTIYAYQDEIMYAQKTGSYVKVVLTGDREISILSSISNLYENLTGFDHFYPLSEKVIMNITFVEKIKLLKVTTKNGNTFSVSPRFFSRIKEAFSNPS